MRFPLQAGAAIGAAVATALLAGCSGNVAAPTTIGPANPTTITQTINGHLLQRSSSVVMPSMQRRPARAFPRTIAPDGSITCNQKKHHKTHCLLFVSVPGNSSIAYYDINDKRAKLAGSITSGISNPQGLGANGAQLLVANTDLSNILEFKVKGTPSLVRTMSDTTGFPTGVAAAAGDGNIYVANVFDTSGNGEVRKYTPSDNTGVVIGDVNLASVFFVAVKPDDSAICVDGFSVSPGGPEVDCSTNGGTTWTNTGITIGYPGGLAFDTSGNLVVDDQAGPITDAGTGVSISCPGTDCVDIAFGPNDTHIYTADAGSGAAYQIDWPAGSIDFAIGGPSSAISAQPIPD